MRVAILGAGGIALGTAAVLAQAGHRAVLWSPSGRGTAPFETGANLSATGAVTLTTPVDTAADVAGAVAGVDAVVVALPGNAHRMVMDVLAPVLVPGQTVILSAQLSLGALYLSRLLTQHGRCNPIVAWSTTVPTARVIGPTAVAVSSVRGAVDLATVPAEAAPAAQALCTALFGPRFRPCADGLAIALSNLNPPVHMANALANLTRMERGETWFNYDGMTPAVGRLIEALDRERLAVAAGFGLSVRTVHDHFHLSAGVPRGPIAEMAAEIHRRRGGPPGPTSLESRFITEDVPFGLVPIAALGRSAGVPVPLHDAGIAVFSALCARDFAAENDLLPSLNLEHLSPAELHRRVRDGWPVTPPDGRSRQG